MPDARREGMTASRTIEIAPNTLYHEFGEEYVDGARVTVGWSEEDKAWIAQVSGCAHDSACLADGPTKQAALLALATSMGATLDCIEGERAKEAAECERLRASLAAAREDGARLDWWLWDNFGICIDGYDIENMAAEEFDASGCTDMSDEAFKPFYFKHGRIAIDTARSTDAARRGTE